MKTLEDAIAFAALKHQNQVDKAGAPYILHPFRVMLNLGAAASTRERMAAMLHDVVEDCEVSLEDLRAMGTDEEVVTAVDALTKRPEEKGDYMAAIRRLSSNSIARRVKLGDLTDNMDESRLAVVTDKDWARIEKYHGARAFLEEIEAQSKVQ